ncbi:MAG TPA: hypothetical protein VKB93_12045 [Thermoanaerobaculia bacterium]|nr:hypothetical protein [Thermoanaerobaculia bacterium]
MNLEHLRTPNPLTGFDYAAVRARVHSELARRRERRWWVFRFAYAFAAAVLVVLAMITPEPLVIPAAVQRAALNHGAAGFSPPEPDGGLKPAAPRPRRKMRPRRHSTQATVAAARIEIHTADPDVRIIWIVPKENS